MAGMAKNYQVAHIFMPPAIVCPMVDVKQAAAIAKLTSIPSLL